MEENENLKGVVERMAAQLEELIQQNRTLLLSQLSGTGGHTQPQPAAVTESSINPGTVDALRRAVLLHHLETERRATVQRLQGVLDNYRMNNSEEPKVGQTSNTSNITDNKKGF